MRPVLYLILPIIIRIYIHCAYIDIYNIVPCYHYGTFKIDEFSQATISLVKSSPMWNDRKIGLTKNYTNNVPCSGLVPDFKLQLTLSLRLNIFSPQI